MAIQGRVAQISISNGGVPKLRILEAQVTALGIVGDRQRDRRYHGGPERAICAFSLEVIEALAREGHPIAPGTTGENLTVSGIDWALVVPGTKLIIGEVELEMASFAAPCRTIQQSFFRAKFKRISHKHHPKECRAYFRVNHEGTIREGDVVALIDGSNADRGSL